MPKNKSLLPTYHHQPTSPTNGRSSPNASYDEVTWRGRKHKILALAGILFLCSLWTVSHFSGTTFDINTLNKYTDNAAARAAASVMGEGGEEGIHSLEVETHGVAGSSGHTHSVHNTYLDEFDDDEPSPEDENGHGVEPETPLEREIDDIIHDHPIVIFSKTYCPYSRRAKHILAQYSTTPHPYVVEVDQRDDADEVKAALIKFTYQGTFPNIFVDGRSLGGSEELAILKVTGKLDEILLEAGVIEEAESDGPEFHRR